MIRTLLLDLMADKGFSTTQSFTTLVLMMELHPGGGITMLTAEKSNDLTCSGCGGVHTQAFHVRRRTDPGW